MHNLLRFLLELDAPGLNISNIGAGSVIAIAVRKVVSSYNGFCLEVRRSSDNALQNIGFTASGNLDISALLAFVGSSSGFVRTWYDQSGNGYSPFRNNNNRQPRIVNNGVLEVDLKGNPKLVFSGDQFLKTASTPAFSQPNSIFSVAAFSEDSGRPYLYDGRDSSNRHIIVESQSSDGDYAYFSGSEIASSTAIGNRDLTSSFFDHPNSDFYINNLLALSGASTGSQSFSPIVIGAKFNGQSNTRITGEYQELISFNSDKRSERSVIQADINSYYGVY